MNRDELRAEIARQNIRKCDIAKALGISDTAFYNKLQGATEFKESEIKKLISLLNLSASAVNIIFLS